MDFVNNGGFRVCRRHYRKPFLHFLYDILYTNPGVGLPKVGAKVFKFSFILYSLVEVGKISGGMDAACYSNFGDKKRCLRSII
jgi:hypothetical protein